MAASVAQQHEESPVATRIRWIAVRGIAAAATGVVVLGVGSRLVMLASRFLHRDAIGRLTENGNRIGEFTIVGTGTLLVFVGLFGGITAGFIWVALRQWLPARPAVVAAAALALGGSTAVTAENRDFVILAPATVDVLLLLAMVAAFGAALPVVDRWLDERLPPVRGRLTTALYALPVLLVTPLLIPLGGGFFSREFCFCEDPPVWTGIALVAAATASVWWWVAAARGADEPPDGARRLGIVATAAAILLGAVDVVGEVAAVL